MMKCRSLLSVLLLVCAGLLGAACDVGGRAGATPTPEPEEGVSLLMSMSSPFHISGQQTFSFRVPVGEDFTATMNPTNLGEKELLGAFVCLLDFRQVPCVEKQGAVFRYRLRAGQEGSFPLRLKGLTAGRHELVRFTFYDTDNHDMKPDFRQMTRFMMQAVRVTLFVGSGSEAPKVVYVTSSQPDTLAQQGEGLFVLSDQPLGERETKPWRSKDVSAGATVPYHITFNNPGNKAVEYAVVAVLDYEQVPLGASSPALYVRVESKERMSIATSLVAPRRAGAHELVVVLLDKPYLDQLAEASKPEQERAGGGSECSERVLIRVR